MNRRRVSTVSPCRPPIVVIVVIIIIMTGSQQQVRGYRPYPDPGPDILQWQKFCGTRPPGDQCCPNRIDACTVPILDTLCYCDDFCDRTVSDCCPDFWSECRGLSPQPFNLSTTPRPPFTSTYTIIYHFGSRPTGCGKKWTPKVFRCFLATVQNSNLKFYSFIIQHLLHLTAE